MDSFPVLNSMPFSDPISVQDFTWDNHYELLPLETHIEQLPSVPMTPLLEAPSAFTGLLDDMFLPNPVLVTEEVHHSIPDPNNVIVAVPEEGTSSGTDGIRLQGHRRPRDPLKFEVLSSFFHLTIRQAAKELKVGETFLKDSCRELGINRWPYRKLKSLNKLILNVPTPRFGGEDEKMRILRELEEKREMILENPNLELDEKTIRLLNKSYKRDCRRRKYRKLVDLYSSVPPEASSSAPLLASTPTPVLPPTSEALEEDEFISLLLEDFCPSNDFPSSSALFP